MFKKSTIISLSVFFILMIFTSVVKNSARNIEKNIDSLNHEISALEKQLNDAKIDFVYFSSPEKLRESLSDFEKKNYLSFDYSRIFLSTEEFLSHSLKKIKNFEKTN